MPKSKVIIIHLRRPKSKAACPEEMRSDPFWEFGSFGITGCHGTNLMHPRNAKDLVGNRLAFAQGGKEGTRLVYLTPPVEVVEHYHLIEAKWGPIEKPFRYAQAPILASNTCDGDFPQLEAAVRSRGKIEGGFGTRFRSRVAPLDPYLAEEVIRVYERRRRNAQKSALAEIYSEALPWDPPKVDQSRKRTYKKLLAEAGKAPRHRSCVKDHGTCGRRSPGNARKPKC